MRMHPRSSPSPFYGEGDKGGEAENSNSFGFILKEKTRNYSLQNLM